MFVEVLQAQAGGPRGYRLRRIILTNFWLYGLQEFEIPHGRLFLAGEKCFRQIDRPDCSTASGFRRRSYALIASTPLAAANGI